MPVGEFVAALSRAGPSPAGGSTAALTVTLAASLCVMAAALSTRQLPPGEQLGAEARRLRDLAAPLAQADAEAYAAVLAARRPRSGAAADAQRGGGEERQRRARLTAALAQASEVPLEVARIGTGVAALAARLAAGGNPAVRGDAVAAAVLAAAAARTAAVLVAINAAGQRAGDRPARAQQYARDAEQHARDAEQHAR